MNQRAPFTPEDLAELDESLLSRASAVVAKEDCYDGHRDPNAIVLRHDVDGMNNNTRHALDTAVKIAEWEAERGYRATFYMLHTAPYWMAPGFAGALDRIAEMGHEIGIHTDALAEALRTGGDPDQILHDAIGTLRDLGFRIRGVAGHGNPLCNRDAGPNEPSFANDEQFLECARPQEGAPNRSIWRARYGTSLTLKPQPLSHFGLEYEALKLAYDVTGNILPFRISDSGGRWLNPGWDETVERWQGERQTFAGVTVPNKFVRQLHFLWHPDWWQHAFVPVAV